MLATRRLAMALALTLGMTSGAWAADPDWLKSPKKPLSDVTIGFANLGPGVIAYAATYLKVFNQYAQELGIKTVVLDSQADAANPASQIMDLIAQRVDAMVVWPVNGKGVAPFVRRAYNAGIPVVITNSNIDPSGAEYIAAYTGPDDYHEAYLAGKMMIDALHGHGNVVMLNGIPGYTVTQLRNNGFRDAIKTAPGITVLDSQPAYFSQEKAQTLMENYITHYGDKIDGVFSVDSGVGAGALSAVQAAESDGKLKNGHIQLVDATIFGGIYDAIKAGAYYGSVVQSPEDDAKVALRTAVMAAEGMTVPKKVFLPMPTVTSATIGTIPHPSF